MAQKKKLSDSEFKKVVWDYTLDQDAFLDILLGKKAIGWFTQEWAIARVLENLDYYRAMDLVGRDMLSEKWSSIKDNIHDPSIKRGYEYLLRKSTLSPAR